jgi:SAM-dependent methyltransferase
MITEQKKYSLVSLLRCAQKNSQGTVCQGTLHKNEDILTCYLCGYQYKDIQSVPVLKSEALESSDTWFEHMYTNRSRTLELASSYLQNEREFMKRFVREHHVQGPCLEIGCGVGLFAETVPEFIGLEYSLESLLVDGFELFNRICADARVIPLADACVECVFSFHTLEHVPDVDLAFAEMHRVLKPGGFLVLKPAWHCTRYNTELIPVLPYHQLNIRQKFTKALLPLLRSKLYKLLTRFPHRLWRRVTCQKNNSLFWGRLTPYHGELWISDADATASLDSHEAMLYYQSRGYQCLSHVGAFKQLLAGHDIVVLRKPSTT